MSGELDLGKLLKTLSVVMADDVYVFATVPHGDVPNGLQPRMVFQEAEGTTLIITQDQAKANNIPYEFASRMITLNVHSSLEAVGFIAHIGAVLAKHNMGVNPVAGFYHDHLFIAQDRAEEAMTVLQNLAAAQ